jgi:outer membrane biosynthesis protein TonB
VLPRRLGARFALEALFLVALAVGAGLADLRPLLIVLVMVAAWLLVALAEVAAERIERSPLSYLLPSATPAAEEEPQEVFGPQPEERTVVAPPLAEPEAAAEHPPEPEPIPEPAPEPEPVPEPEPLPKPEPIAAAEASRGGRFRGLLRRKDGGPEAEPEAPAEAEPAEEPDSAAEPEPAVEPEPAAEPEPVANLDDTASIERPRRRGLLRRKESEAEPAAPAPPRHVKLLPRRSADEPSRAEHEVAELFGPRPNDADDDAPSEEAGP